MPTIISSGPDHISSFSAVLIPPVKVEAAPAAVLLEAGLALQLDALVLGLDVTGEGAGLGERLTALLALQPLGLVDGLHVGGEALPQ